MQSDGRCRLDTYVGKENDGPSVCIVCRRAKPMSNEDTVTVCPEGFISNEELIFQYGSKSLDPQGEVIMINCPIPPFHEWDKNLTARIALLQQRGLMPQIFLSRRHLDGVKSKIHKGGRFRGMKSLRPRAAQVQEIFPPNVYETLEAFVLEEDEVREELNAGKPLGNSGHSEIASSGLRMAILTTATRLLEVKLDELESFSNGTGPLEVDLKLLENIQQEKENTTAMPHSGPTNHQMVALYHRIEQKRLVREYLNIFNDELKEEMKHLNQLNEKSSQEAL